MQSKDKASLNVKCYKRLYHTILWQRDGNSCCIFSHSIQKEKEYVPISPQTIYWPKMMAHTLSTPSNTTMSLRQTMLDHIKTVSGHSPHAGGIPSLNPWYNTRNLLFYTSWDSVPFLLAVVHGTWDLISRTRDQTCKLLHWTHRV